jgi:NADPH-dependent ferric siderophore reductase
LIQPGTVVRHDFAIRDLTVTAIRKLSPGFVRVTLGGSDLEGFVSSGPSDHCKVFFPDPATGTITAPTVVDGSLQRPTSGTIYVRDYTPRAFRDGASPELDIDFYLHGDGVASAWAASASMGDRLVVAGPRGSRMPPTGMTKVILAADETALPSLARWIEELPEGIEIVAFAKVASESDAAYLEPAHVNRARLIWLESDPDALERAFRARGLISEDTAIWAAGEATSLIPLRRYLRRELGLPAAQVKIDGYWKQGEIGHDHHAPVDPSDPED